MCRSSGTRRTWLPCKRHCGSALPNHLGLILKIELVAAFTRLPQILLEALRADRVGVMIARGDLAVEAGYERVAELQEEIMWLCEAAHVPVIWATEVLDRLARTGRPSRAEITDAAISQQAECVDAQQRSACRGRRAHPGRHSATHGPASAQEGLRC